MGKMYGWTFLSMYRTKIDQESWQTFLGICWQPVGTRALCRPLSKSLREPGQRWSLITSSQETRVLKERKTEGEEEGKDFKTVQ